jgi:hypothetical protein
MVHAPQTHRPQTKRRSRPIAELVREQRIPSERPDYVALFSKVWHTPEEVTEFQRHIRAIRRASRD